MAPQPFPFGKILVKAREERGLSQYALAQKMGKDKRWINLVEHGKRAPWATSIIAFAQALDMDPTVLFSQLAVRLGHPSLPIMPAISPQYAAFTQALVTARNNANLSQDEVAKELGRPTSFVSLYESGERRLDIVEVMEIARVLGVKVSTLLGEA